MMKGAPRDTSVINGRVGVKRKDGQIDIQQPGQRFLRFCIATLNIVKMKGTVGIVRWLKKFPAERSFYAVYKRLS